MRRGRDLQKMDIREGGGVGRRLGSFALEGGGRPRALQVSGGSRTGESLLLPGCSGAKCY